LREGFGGGKIDIGDPDKCAGAGELFYGGFADAAGSAGDKGVAMVEAEGLWWRGVVHGWRQTFIDTVAHCVELRGAEMTRFGSCVLRDKVFWLRPTTARTKNRAQESLEAKSEFVVSLDYLLGAMEPAGGNEVR
jgi:hypothetical protein